MSFLLIYDTLYQTVKLLANIFELCQKLLQNVGMQTRTKIGYARASTQESLRIQVARLEADGCVRVFSDLVAAEGKRVQFGEALLALKPGTTLVVVSLDRIGPTLGSVIEALGVIRECGSHFRSLADGIHSEGSAGDLLFNFADALSRCDKVLRGERSKASFAKAKTRGVQLGRKKILSRKQLLKAKALLAEGKTNQEVADALDISRSTLYRALREDD